MNDFLILFLFSSLIKLVLQKKKMLHHLPSNLYRKFTLASMWPPCNCGPHMYVRGKEYVGENNTSSKLQMTYQELNAL